MSGCGPSQNSPWALIVPGGWERHAARRLRQVIDYALPPGRVRRLITEAGQLTAELRGWRLLFAVESGLSGVDPAYYSLLQKLRLSPHLLDNCLGAVIVDGGSELYTKSTARDLVFAANQAGCAFIGRPLVEGTGSLANFRLAAQVQDTDEYTAYLRAGRELTQRLEAGSILPAGRGEVVVLHDSPRSTSNTLLLWEMIRSYMKGRSVTEIALRNGEIEDCNACPFKTCRHYGEQGLCFYGGGINEDVYPAIQRCHTLVLLCPNYNDAVSANISACINRLTGLFRQVSFSQKKLHAVIVSGYSGGDLVAGQLIAALNMNKSFFLPARFCLLETANDPGAIRRQPGIEQRASAFAATI